MGHLRAGNGIEPGQHRTQYIQKGLGCFKFGLGEITQDIHVIPGKEVFLHRRSVGQQAFQSVQLSPFRQHRFHGHHDLFQGSIDDEILCQGRLEGLGAATFVVDVCLGGKTELSDEFHDQLRGGLGGDRQ